MTKKNNTTMWYEIKRYFWCKKHGLNYINWGLIECKAALKFYFKENFIKPLIMVSVPGLIVTAIIIIIVKLCGYDMM